MELTPGQDVLLSAARAQLGEPFVRVVATAFLLVAVTATPGCAGARNTKSKTQTQQAPVVFLRQPKITTPSAMMTLVGTLGSSREGCLVLTAENQNWLIFWPPETRLLRTGGASTITDSSGNKAVVGDRVELGGTGAGPPKVSALGGVTIPTGCRNMNVWITNLKGVKKLAE